MSGSTQRKIAPPFRGKRGHCSWCGTAELPKGRSSWCSDACVSAYRMRSDPGYVRAVVFSRDKGICALCGRDAEAEYRDWQDRAATVARLSSRLIEGYRFRLIWNGRRMVFPDRVAPNGTERNAFTAHLMTKYNPGAWTRGRSSGWDADHILPVVEGGGECGLENYRTLCHPCHKIATAELAARRSAARRGFVKTSLRQPELILTFPKALPT